MEEKINDIRLMLIQISNDFERLARDIDILSGCLYKLKEEEHVEHKFKAATNKEG